jgi:hypothetical protein
MQFDVNIRLYEYCHEPNGQMMDQKFVYVVHIENAFCHVHKLLFA